MKAPDDEVIQKCEEFCEKNSVELLERHEDSSVFLSFKPDSVCPLNDFDCGGIFGVRINIRDESPVYAFVYNAHNGYYCHAIYYTDVSLKVDCFETDYL